MSEKSKSLSRVKRDIYREIAMVKDDFASFSALDKLTFVQRAFNNVNNYYANIPLALNPNYTKFGFFMGKSNVNATAFINSRAIGFDLETALTARNPIQIYETMFHEFRHIWHDNASLYPRELKMPRFINTKNMPKPLAKVVDFSLRPARNLTTLVTKPFRFIGNSCLYRKAKNGYSVSAHEASLNEIDADRSAFSSLEDIFMRAMERTRNPQTAEGLLIKTQKAKLNCMKGHAMAVANVLTFGKLFVNPADKKAMETSGKAETIGKTSGPVTFFSLAQASQVISKNPETFETEEGISGAGSLFSAYAKEHGEERHYLGNFFGRFSQHNFRRSFQKAEFARFSRTGKLIDQEELETDEMFSSSEEDFLKRAVLGARERKRQEIAKRNKSNREWLNKLQEEEFLSGEPVRLGKNDTAIPTKQGQTNVRIEKIVSIVPIVPKQEIEIGEQVVYASGKETVDEDSGLDKNNSLEETGEEDSFLEDGDCLQEETYTTVNGHSLKEGSMQETLENSTFNDIRNHYASILGNNSNSYEQTITEDLPPDFNPEM